MTKRHILFIGIFGSFLFLLPILFSMIWGCYQKDWFFCSDQYEIIMFITVFAPPLLLLSLISYWMREEVFHAWWGFGRWMIPIIVITTFLLNIRPTGRGYMGWSFDEELNSAVVVGLLCIFTGVSLAKIMLKHWEIRSIEKGRIETPFLLKHKWLVVISFIIVFITIPIIILNVL